MEVIIGSLVDYGMAGIFLAFMVWNYLQGQKRMDSLQDKFLEAIDKCRKENKDNEELIRSRYDKVIQTYQSDKDHLLTDFKTTIKDLTSTIQRLEDMEKSSLIKIEQVDDSIGDIEKLLQIYEQERKAKKKATLIALAQQQSKKDRDN